MTALLPVYDRDLVIVSGKGALLTDNAGNTYLDFAAGIGVNGLGYGNRKVLNAIKKQSSKLIHSSNLYFTEPVTRLADELVKASFPARVFFTNSGTESVEAAIKFARRVGNASGRTELVAFEGGFHGRTMGALSITWKEKYRAPFEPLVPGVRFCPWNDLAAAKSMIGPKTAGVFIEPVQGEGGIRIAPDDFLHGLSDICREAGALFVSDEVQCGLGRTGAMFAFERAHIRPDIVTLAKPLGGGLPLGAVLLREELASALQVGDHGSTFGGNPVAAAASLVVMDKLRSGGFLGKIEKKGKMLQRNLRAMQRKYPKQIRDVRGLGLMLGVELCGPASPVVAGLRARGILATKAGENVLRLLPPLVVKRSELQSFLVAFDEVLSKGEGMVQMEGGGGAVA
jgi:acetylornithine/N-succinyldiaminopimelate aminotransferase